MEDFPEEVFEHFQGGGWVGGGKRPGSQQRVSAQSLALSTAPGRGFLFGIPRHSRCSANLVGTQQTVLD